MTSDSDRVLADGVPITLKDGSEVTVRFSMRALKYLEDAFGTIDEADWALNGRVQILTDEKTGKVLYETDEKGRIVYERDEHGHIVKDEANKPRAKLKLKVTPPDPRRISVIAKWMAAGLVDEDISEDELYDLLSIKKNAIGEYGDAVKKALDLALGGDGERPPKGRRADRRKSTSRAGTSQRQSSTAEATSSSGA